MEDNRQTSLRLPADVRRWIRHRAADRDVTLAQVITDLCRAEMTRSEPTTTRTAT